jgi:hypothetical protein
MISIDFDLKPLRAMLIGAQQDQVPFAASKALNDTAFQVRAALQDQMTKDFDQVTAFTRAAVQVRKASKRNLVAEVFIEQKRLKYLGVEIKGGNRFPANKALIIPAQDRKNNRNLRPKLLARKDAFEATINGLDGIWQRRAGGHVKLLAMYKPKASYKPRFKFYERGRAVARQRFGSNFNNALRFALATAR